MGLWLHFLLIFISTNWILNKESGKTKENTTCEACRTPAVSFRFVRTTTIDFPVLASFLQAWLHAMECRDWQASTHTYECCALALQYFLFLSGSMTWPFLRHWAHTNFISILSNPGIIWLPSTLNNERPIITENNFLNQHIKLQCICTMIA